MSGFKQLTSSTILLISLIISMTAASLGLGWIAYNGTKDLPDTFVMGETEAQIEGVAFTSTPLEITLQQLSQMNINGWTKHNLGGANQIEEIRNSINSQISAANTLYCSQETLLKPQITQHYHYEIQDKGLTTFTVATYPPGVSPYALEYMIDNCVSTKNLKEIEDGSKTYYEIKGSTNTTYITVLGDTIISSIGANNSLDITKEWFTEASKIFRTQGCANLNPAIGDELRNKTYVGDEKYVQLVKSTKTQIDDLPLTVTNPETENEEPLLTKEDNVPAPEELSIPNTPSSHEYWPAMPTLPELPQPPVILAQPENTDTILTPIIDEIGPGCGWDFTSYKKTTQPSEEQIELETNQLITDSEDKLTEAQNKYLESVINFYATIEDYEEALKDYNDIQEDIDEVYSQWLVLQKEWENYDDAKQEYDEAWESYELQKAAYVDAEETFQEQTETYEQQIQACQRRQQQEETYNKEYEQYLKDLEEYNQNNPVTPTPTPTPQPTASPQPSPTPTATPPTPLPESNLTCPPEPPTKPAILDGEPPQEPTIEEPTPPSRES